MYNVLKQNLKSRSLYLMVDTSLGIRLSVPEKLKLIMYLRNTDHTCWNDLWQHTMNYFQNNDYRSAKFDWLQKAQQKVDEERVVLFKEVFGVAN